MAQTKGEVEMVGYWPSISFVHLLIFFFFWREKVLYGLDKLCQ